MNLLNICFIAKEIKTLLKSFGLFFDIIMMKASKGILTLMIHYS